MIESNEMEGKDTPKNVVGMDEIVVLTKECEVNEMAYYGVGTWFMSNWLTPNLSLFSIVGRPGGTRKRPYGKSGSWWRASGFCPGTRRSTARKAMRRILSVEGTGEDVQEDEAHVDEGVLGSDQDSETDRVK